MIYILCCLMDALPPLINVSRFFQPEHSYSNPLLLMSWRDPTHGSLSIYLTVK